MIVYGLLFLLIVAAATYTLGSLVVWLRNPNRRSIAGPVLRVAAVGSVAWSASLFVPFVAEWLGRGADTFVGAVWLITLIGATIIASRSVRGIWGPIASGTVLAIAVWFSAIGIYTMHAIGWQDLSLDDLQSGDAGVARIWIGALFFAPGAFALGFLLGLVSPHIIWRRQTPAAQ